MFSTFIDEHSTDWTFKVNMSFRLFSSASILANSFTSSVLFPYFLILGNKLFLTKRDLPVTPKLISSSSRYQLELLYRFCRPSCDQTLLRCGVNSNVSVWTGHHQNSAQNSSYSVIDTSTTVAKFFIQLPMFLRQNDFEQQVLGHVHKYN